MPSDLATVYKNGAQVSRRCLSFSPVYRFGDGHASIPDRSSFILLETLNDLSYQERAMSAASAFPCYPISWTSTYFFHLVDNNLVATFVSHYMITEYVLASELVQVATWLS